MNRLRIWHGAFAFLHTRLPVGLYHASVWFCSTMLFRSQVYPRSVARDRPGGTSGRFRPNAKAPVRCRVSQYGQPRGNGLIIACSPLRGARGTSPWSVRAARNIGSGRVLRIACKRCCIPRWVCRLDEVARHQRRTEQGASTGERQTVRGRHRILNLTDPRP